MSKDLGEDAYCFNSRGGEWWSDFLKDIYITISWTLDVKSGDNMELRLASSYLTLAHRLIIVPGTTILKAKKEVD